MASEEGTQDEGLVKPVAPVSATPPEPAPVETVSKADLSELRDELKGWIDNGTERTKQSQRDAIKARVKQVVGEELGDTFATIDRFSELFDKGVDPKQLKVDALLEHLANEPSETGEPAPSRPDETFVEREVRGVVEKHGLSGSEPELKQYMTEAKGQSLYNMLSGLEKVAVEVAEKRKATPAGILPSGSSPPAKPDLDQKFIEEMWAAKGQGMAAGRVIKEKYRALGVKVDQIGFGPDANP